MRCPKGMHEADKRLKVGFSSAKIAISQQEILELDIFANLTGLVCVNIDCDFDFGITLSKYRPQLCE